MASQRKPVVPQSPSAALPAVCVVTADEEFHALLTPEFEPWFQVVFLDSFDGLARWTREAGIAAVLLDIDTEGEEAYGGLSVLNELRSLNSALTLICSAAAALARLKTGAQRRVRRSFPCSRRCG